MLNFSVEMGPLLLILPQCLGKENKGRLLLFWWVIWSPLTRQQQSISPLISRMAISLLVSGTDTRSLETVVVRRRGEDEPCRCHGDALWELWVPEIVELDLY